METLLTHAAQLCLSYRASLIVCVVRWGVRAADRQWQREQAERSRIAELTARAEQQRTWVLEGDDRGVYGEYPTAAM